MTEPAFRKLTEDEYLRLLEESDVRYEYIDGFVYAQAGASNAHNIIAGNLQFALYTAARRKGCRVYQSDMRLQVLLPNGQNKYYFPDLMVSCEPSTYNPETIVLAAPCLLVEILSKSTFREDKSDKWQIYQTLESLQTYLMIDSLSRSAALYQRTDNGWDYQEIGESIPIQLPCLDLTLTLADLYEGTGL